MGESDPTKRTSINMTIQTDTEMLSTESLTSIQPMTPKELATTITKTKMTSTGSTGAISALTSESEPTKRTSIIMTTKIITLIPGAFSTSTLSSKHSESTKL